jgi:alpha-L-rhamnosidase
VKAGYDSPQGRIESHWRWEGDQFTLTVKIPANTTATVGLPTSHAEKITESGMPLGDVKEVMMREVVDGRAVLEVQSGTYMFNTPITSQRFGSRGLTKSN